MKKTCVKKKKERNTSLPWFHPSIPDVLIFACIHTVKKWRGGWEDGENWGRDGAGQVDEE